MKYTLILLLLLPGFTVFAQNGIVSQTGSKGLIIGNSTIATYSCGKQIGEFLFTSKDSLLGNTYHNQAVPGDSIVGQMSRFIANNNKKLYDWVLVEIGLNDLKPNVPISTTMTKYQNLVNAIRSYGKPGVKIILSSMIPCKQRLIDLHGATNGLLSYQKWLKMNSGIIGEGEFKITGVDYRVNEHVALLNDGSGNLSSQYDCGDHIHENNAARALIASVWRKALNEIGFLKIQESAMNYDPDLWMPDTIPVALGNSIELYNNNIAFVKLNDKNINFKWKSKVGSSDSLKWSWTADQTGKFKLTLNCFFKDSLIDSIHTTLKVVDKVHTSPKNLLAIGNSLTQGGFEYLFAQISKELDFELNPIGTRGTKVKNEGHSGWLFESFLNNKSPFFIDSCINFKKYILNNNLPNPDIIRISLGINDCYLNSSHPLNLIMKNATSLIDTIYNDYPNSLIVLALPSTCESTGSGWQQSYKNLDNFEPYQLHMRELRKRIYAKFGCGRYKPNIIVSYDGLCIDRKNGYPANNGVHPNPKGYAQLAKGFSNTLNDYMIRKNF